jgi:hypothetical protein
VAEELSVRPSKEWVQDMVEEARSRDLFAPLRNPKSEGLLLLELCSDPEVRPRAIHALRWLHLKGKDDEAALVRALVACGHDLSTATLCESHESWMQHAAPVAEHELPRQRKLVEISRAPVDHYQPAATDAGRPDRHPWDGFLGELSFGELSAGMGMFAACFEAAGAACKFLVEPNAGMVARAAEACGSDPVTFDSITEVDPSELPWVHILVAGTECQPFSKRGKRRAWEDDRAYTLIRAIHVAAVMQPWMCWFENVANIRTLHGGKVWEAVHGMVTAAGFVLKEEVA